MTQQYWDFIRSTAATHQIWEPEIFAELLSYNALCDTQWPIWVLVKNNEPVAWWNECNGTAGIRSDLLPVGVQGRDAK